MLGKNDDASENFGPHKNEKFTIDKQKMEKDYKDLVGKSSDIGSRTRDGLSGHTL